MRIAPIISAALLLMICVESTVSAQTAQDTPDQHTKVALRYLWEPLKREYRGGRIYYGMSECGDVRWETPFPEILIPRPEKDITDVATLRRFFAKDTGVRISDDNGIIRMRFGSVPLAILRTKISEINFSVEDQYNPEFALAKIENAPEVQARMKSLGIRILALPWDFLVAPPTPGAFLLPSVMRQISMDEALDVVATTFRGLVETAYCKKSRLMDSDIVGYDRN